MRTKGLVFLLTASCYLLLITPAFASTHQFITVVNPVRGADYFTLPNAKPVTNFQNEWLEVEKRNLPATWLLRPDALDDQSIISLAKFLPNSQELGLFLEITPTWAKEAGVTYHQDINWHEAGSVFLTGYSVDERHKLIDNAFEKFKSDFGYYPKSVGAWWIDANSLSYMKDKFGVVANMDVADQYSTDNYEVWGQYFSTPFYPAKRNALVPASGPEQKIGIVTIQWATRDPFNSYGNGVLDSTYSVQANDYANPKYHSLDTNYFKKLLSIYLDNPYGPIGQVTVGLENDFNWFEYGGEFARQLDVVNGRKQTGTRILTMSQFSSAYQNLFNLTPPQIIYSGDPLGSGGQVLWYQNLNYRVGWFYNSSGSLIRDLRLFRDGVDEPCLEKACSNLDLAETQTHNLDEVTYGENWQIDEGAISNVKFSPVTDGVQVNYQNSAGMDRTIKFVKNDVIIDSSPLPISTAIGLAIKNSDNIQKVVSNFSYTLKDGLKKTLLEQTKAFLIFLIFSIFFFYLPGLAMLKKTTLRDNPKFILAWPVGLTIFTLVSFILGYLNFYWGVLVLPFVSVLVIRKSYVRPRFKFSLQGLVVGLIIMVGSLTWLSTMVKSGLQYDFGLGFWGANGHDGMWHLSLVESLKHGLPPQNPIFAGVNLQNYHYFFDLCLAAVSVITKLSANDLYFRFFPIFLSLLIGAVSFLVANSWFKSKLAGSLALFFVYFGGSFGWLVSYFKDRSLGGETLFWAQQGISTLINPPFAASLLLFLAGLYLFKTVLANHSNDNYGSSEARTKEGLNFSSLRSSKNMLWILQGGVVPLVILWGTLIEFKAYAGLLVLGSLAILSLIKIIKGRFSFLYISVPVAVLSALVFLPNNLGGGNLLQIDPFWLIHSMVDSADRLNWARLSLTRTAGLESGNYFKFLAAEIIGLVIFIVGNLGTRIFGGIRLIREVKEDKGLGIFVVSFLGLSLVVPLIFVQKGGAFNIVQFFYYFLLVFNFLAAGALAALVSKFKKAGWLVIVVIVLLTVPTTFDTLGQYLPKRPPAMVPAGEVAALNFLKSQPNGIVLSFFDEKQAKKYDAPVPLFAYTTTSYVGAYSGKAEYVADTINLEILGIDYKGRLQTQKDIFSQKEPEQIKKVLKSEKISYIYAIKSANFNNDPKSLGLEKIFGNDEVTIYKVI